MIYYCVVASAIALLLAPVAIWRTRQNKSCSSETTVQQPLQTAKDEQTSSPCSRAYEVMDPTTSEMQENAIYHVLDGQTEETSLEVQERPTTSTEQNKLPKYDRSIQRDTKSRVQQHDQSSLYHVIDIL